MIDPRQMRLALVPVESTIDIFTAARMAGVSVETIRRWCDEGRITSYKLVGRWRIDRDAYVGFLRSAGVQFRTPSDPI